MEDAELAFTSLISVLELRCSEVKKNIKDQEQKDLDRAADHKKKLELKLAELMEKEDTIDKLLKTEDNIYFVQVGHCKYYFKNTVITNSYNN